MKNSFSFHQRMYSMLYDTWLLHFAFCSSFCLYALSQSRHFIDFHRSVVLSNIACIQVCLLPKWILRGVALNNEIYKTYETIICQTQLMCIYFFTLKMTAGMAQLAELLSTE